MKFLQANEKQLAENVVRTFYLKFDNSATLHFEKLFESHKTWTTNSEQSVSVCFYEYNLTIVIDIIEVNSLQTLQEFFKQGIDTLDR